ncbi:NAD(P)-binding protein [Penicillium macrosclerotiorum]|uniref:NAD(P)-binding protein n=1 Tax=Penicillium macrosclerotiorum TaxID=303699 RepID=UPI0025467165|nr:NAD(P)-binding protein [Penicillium macrosclerotiorum]KAJ5688555.1 NAD(P)-binding protein [Penicillium macrosclerotiorum]
MDGMGYVLDLASPLPRGIDKNDYFLPAVKETTAVLKEVTRVSSIKKIVVTSSIGALFPLGGLPDGDIIREDNDWDFSVNQSANFVDRNYPIAAPMRLYTASKLLVNEAPWEFRDTAKPHYSLVSIHPSYVYGHNLVQESAEEVKRSSNGGLWSTIMNGVPARSITGVHIQDVAEVHIKALDPNVLDGTRYLNSGKKATWKEVGEVVQREYSTVGAKIAIEIDGVS